MKVLTILLLIAGLSTNVLSQDKTYTCVFLNPVRDMSSMSETEIDKIQNVHTQFFNRLFAEGKILVSGPFEGGGGFLILNTANPTKARQWMSDPGVKKNFELEIFAYKPKWGGVCKAGPEAEMVSYTFVRYIPEYHKSNVRVAPNLFKSHEEHLKRVINTGNVVTHAVFSAADGDILVVNGELGEGVLSSDPAVREGFLEVWQRKLSITKGSFCE